MNKVRKPMINYPSKSLHTHTHTYIYIYILEIKIAEPYIYTQKQSARTVSTKN